MGVETRHLEHLDRGEAEECRQCPQDALAPSRRGGPAAGGRCSISQSRCSGRPSSARRTSACAAASSAAPAGRAPAICCCRIAPSRRATCTILPPRQAPRSPLPLGAAAFYPGRDGARSAHHPHRPARVDPPRHAGSGSCRLAGGAGGGGRRARHPGRPPGAGCGHRRAAAARGGGGASAGGRPEGVPDWPCPRHADGRGE